MHRTLSYDCWHFQISYTCSKVCNKTLFYHCREQLSLWEGNFWRDCEGGSCQVTQYKAGGTRRVQECLHICIHVHEEAGHGPQNVSPILVVGKLFSSMGGVRILDAWFNTKSLIRLHTLQCNMSRFVEESNFINEDEPCYRGVLRGGQFKLPEGTGLATVAFRLTVINTHAIEESIWAV